MVIRNISVSVCSPSVAFADVRPPAVSAPRRRLIRARASAGPFETVSSVMNGKKLMGVNVEAPSGSVAVTI